METQFHRFTELFAQLGLPSDAAGIARFIAQHSPLPGNVALADASFWAPAQAALLREGKAQDADWTELVDQLDAALRAKP